jgi:hypothetical protein
MLGLGALGAVTGALAAQPAVPRTHEAPRPSLDLRLPATSLAAAETPEAFPSSLRRQTLGAQHFELPDIGAAGRSRSPGRLEEMARRVHQEGLPVARLWESKAALVHLGLNQKGKPGLWIVQKTH